MENALEVQCEIYLGIAKSEIGGQKREKILKERALVKASIYGDFNKISELLDAETSVDAEGYNKLLFYASKNYVTPLQLTAANGYVKCLQILIDHGANVNAKDRFDVTALHMAAEKGHFECLKVLLEGGADCTMRTKYSKSGCYRAVPHLGGTTALHLAAANNNQDCVIELIQFGADYNAVDECGRTSLYVAAQCGFKECIMAHLKNAVGKDILSLPGYETQDTPLHFAVLHRLADCVRELLHLGSDANHLNIIGCSPLHSALIPQNVHASNNLEIVKLLVLEGYNTDVNGLDSGHFTPLHYVSFTGENHRWLRRPEIAKFLISYGANVNIKNCRGTSLLQCELKSVGKDYEILKYIVKSMLYLPRLKELNLSSLTERFQQVDRFHHHVDRHYLVEDNHMSRHQQLEDHPATLDLWNHRTVEDVLTNYRRHIQPELLSNPATVENILMEMMPFWALDPLGMRPPYPRPHVRYPADEDELQNPPNNANEKIWGCSMLDKRVWYEQMASSPRTLQHSCRYVIRKALGSFRLKLVGKLPIPPAMQSYLLLKSDK